MNSKYIALAVTSLLLLGGGCVSETKSFVGNFIEDKIVDKLTKSDGGDDSYSYDDSYASDYSDSYDSYASVSVPYDFPLDIPIMDATVTGVAVAGVDGTWISFSTDMSESEALAWYADKLYLYGWTSAGTYSTAEMSAASYTKGSATLGVLTSTESDGGTIVVVTESNSY